MLLRKFMITRKKEVRLTALSFVSRTSDTEVSTEAFFLLFCFGCIQQPELATKSLVPYKTTWSAISDLKNHPKKIGTVTLCYRLMMMLNGICTLELFYALQFLIKLFIVFFSDK